MGLYSLYLKVSLKNNKKSFECSRKKDQVIHKENNFMLLSPFDGNIFCRRQWSIIFKTLKEENMSHGFYNHPTWSLSKMDTGKQL